MSTVDHRRVQPGNPAATASQGGGQAVGLPQPGAAIPQVPATFADLAAVKTYLNSLVAALGYP